MPPKASSSLRVECEVNGDLVTHDMLRLMGQRAYNIAPIGEAIGELLKKDVAARAQGQPWLDITDETKARKERQEELPLVMRDERRPVRGEDTRRPDELWDALTTGSGTRISFTRTTVKYGIPVQGDLFYARMVENVKGTKRRLMAVTEEGAFAMAVLVSDYVTFNGKFGITGMSMPGHE